MRMILRKILKLCSYKLPFVQQLKSQDLDFALNFLARMQVDEYWPSQILWTDEVHFHLDSAVNTQNCLLHMGFHESLCRATTIVTIRYRIV